MTEKEYTQTDYQTLGEICRRMRCGDDRIKLLIKTEEFPAVKIGGQYMTTEVKIQEWMNKKITLSSLIT